MDIKQKLSLQNTSFLLEDCEILLVNKLKNENYRLVGYNVGAVEENCGYFSEHFKVTITINYKNNIEEIICFGKIVPNFDSGIDIDLALGAFKKEIFIYNDIFKKFINNGLTSLLNVVPECYFVKHDFMLVFEDLRESGFVSIPRYDYLDYDHVVLIIKALAKVHASSLVFEEKTSQSLENAFSMYAETFYSEKEGHMGTKSLFAALKGIYTEIEIFNFSSSILSKAELKKCIASACSSILEMVKPSKTHRNVLCHGDLWQTNFMMKYSDSKPVQCMLIDFQTARCVPPAQDLMAFLYLTTSRAFRQSHLQEMIDFYYKQLTKHVTNFGYDLKTLIPHTQFIESCETQQIFAAVQSATYFQLTHAKSEYVAELSKDNEKWKEALYEDHSILILENYKTDAVYRHRLEESLKDLIMVCEKIYNTDQN